MVTLFYAIAGAYTVSVKIKSLRLWTNQLAELDAFYRETLGLVVALRPGKLDVNAGHTRITFREAPVGWRSVYHFAFNIPENQFAEAKAWLAQRVPLIRDKNGADEFDFLDWNSHACYYYDPAGNILELIARHTLDCASVQLFSPRSLLGISEIGIVADDVRETAHQLGQKYGLGIYDGAGSDSFTAVGDPSGLFIVVKRGREWYPDTGAIAASSAFSIAFEVNGTLHTWEVNDGIAGRT